MELVKYLKDEVRCGFYIPTAIKQAWWAQLTILKEIDRICDKYNIRYFADWGTLLGAVRHGGYVPWDDDLDICMLRDDYEKFKKAAKDELPENFAIHNFETKDNHWLFLARVVNSNRICFDKEHLDKFCNFPYIATVDIFVQDYLYADEKKEKQRNEEVKYLIAVADGIINGKYSESTKNIELEKIENNYNYKIDRNLDSRNIGIQLYKLIELQMGRTKKEESDKIGQIFPWILKGYEGMPKEYYETTVRLPFEDTIIPVPAAYHKVVSRRYGDYLKIHKVWGGHGYPYFEGQKRNLQEAADFKLPEFTFDKNKLRENQTYIDRCESVKDIVCECIAEIEKLVNSIVNEKGVDILDKLAACQQLAVELGTFIESTIGEERIHTKRSISSLEAFCEHIFALYEKANTGQEIENCMNIFANSWQCALKTLQQQIISSKEILIVATGADRWSGLDSLYRELTADEKNIVYVIATPLMYKDAFGQVKMSDQEIIAACEMDKYPEYVELTAWDSYDITLHLPEEVYVQDPYDEENPCLTIPPSYYVQNMLRYTKKICYIPYMEVGEFEAKDINDIYNMNHYVTAPGVVYADEIWVQSANMKERYVEKLTEFAGKETKTMWEKKVKCVKLPIACLNESKCDRLEARKKKMLFGIGINCLAERNDNLIAVLKEKLDIMKQNVDKLDIGVYLYPAYDVWNSAYRESAEQIMSVIRKYEGRGIHIVTVEECRNIAEIYDAYYGSPMPLVIKFVNFKKPVMVTEFT